MRIICDHCSRPMSGTVTRVAGNFNLHPDCLAQLAKQSNHESTAIAGRSRESLVIAFVDWAETVASLPREMKSAG